jgi:hypothetical protein
MLATLLGALRADIDRQASWARGEVARQLRYKALTGTLAALAAVGVIVTGLIALYRWLATETDPFIALAMIGGGLLLLDLVLLALVFTWRGPRPALRPRLQIAQPAALFPIFSQRKTIAGRKAPLKLAIETIRHGSRAGLLGTLVLVAAIGLVIGRKV